MPSTSRELDEVGPFAGEVNAGRRAGSDQRKPEVDAAAWSQWIPVSELDSMPS